MNVTWDPKKAQANLRKHGVRLSDSEAVLMDPDAISRDDPTTDDERRFVSVGLDATGRILVVVAHVSGRGRTGNLGSTCHCERETPI